VCDGVVHDGVVSGREFANLDLLRSMAVLMVVGCHLWYTVTRGAPATFPAAIGHFGVVIFFVHTSLVLLLSIDRMSLYQRCLFGRFYIRRAFRIYPLSAVCVVVCWFFRIPEVAWMPKVLGGKSLVLANLVLVQNLTGHASISGPLWSLPYEVQMYLALPVVYVAIARSTRRVLVAIAAVIIVGLFLNSRMPVLLFAGFTPCFLAGALAYSLARGCRGSLNAWLWPMLVSALALIYWIAYTPNGPYWVFPSDWAVAAVLGCAIPWFSEMNNPTLKIIANRIARYSYGIYLSHMPLLWLCLVRPTTTPPLARAALFALLITLTPVVLYHGLERPMIQLGIRLAARLSGSSPVEQSGSNEAPEASQADSEDVRRVTAT
jgi:peptidoglycan/LPS O-acetylase OafA/YrhL